MKNPLGKNGFTVGIVMFVGVVTFVGIAIVTNLFSSGDLPVRISGALLEAVITALMTYFLLTGQTSQEEKKEKNGKIFEKKQEVYHNFLKKLQEIIQDGEIKTDVQSADGKIDRTIDELKDLIFQLGYLQMHTSEDTIKDVLSQLANMIQCMNDYNPTEEKDKRKSSPEKFYSDLSKALFTIVSILKEDLYGEKRESKKPESEELKSEELKSIEDRMKEIFGACGLVVDTTDVNEDKYKLQQDFWNELRKQLSKYKLTEDVSERDIQDYYVHARNRHRWYGLTFEVSKLKDGTPVCFKIEIDGEFYYGFLRAKEKEENKEITECLNEIGGFRHSRPSWFGWKLPSPKYRLNFWALNFGGLNSEGFNQLKKPRQREKFIAGLVEEIVTCIEKFKEIAEEKNLLK